MMQRGEIRQKYGLKGNGCTDCLMACCCTPCDLTQQDKEVKQRENEKQAFINQQPGQYETMSYGTPAPTDKQGFDPAPQYNPNPQYIAGQQHNAAPQQYTHAQPYGA
jgi:hypothetical protein